MPTELLFPELQCLTNADIEGMTPDERSALTLRGVIQMANHLQKLNGKVVAHDKDLSDIKQEKIVEARVKEALEKDRLEREKLESEQQEECERQAEAKDGKSKIKVLIPNWVFWLMLLIGGVLLIVGYGLAKLGVNFFK